MQEAFHGDRQARETMRPLVPALAALLATSVPAAADGGAPCTASVYHQLDFFVGNWVVTNKSGKQIATDRVSREFGGCVIWERWFGGSGSRGAGYSGYVPARRRWVQTFMDDRGTVLVFEGGQGAAGFVIEGPSYTKTGALEHNRVVFRTLPHGVVEEYWTTSDGGKTSTVVFDGFFHPKR